MLVVCETIERSASLAHVLDGFATERRRVCSVGNVDVLRRFSADHPDRADDLREALAGGQLRLTGTALHEPDTLLADAEAILRALVVGHRWLLDRDIDVDVRMLALPENLGHSPCLPSLAVASGAEAVVITRIDGMYLRGSDWESPAAFPRRGSSAARLVELGTADFWWRAPDGATVLAHWNSLGSHVRAVPTAGSPRRFVSRLARVAQRLGVLSATPYMLCPIGGAGSAPVRDLVGVVDRFNAEHYERSGVWALNAGMDDHLALVASCELAATLPVLDLDPNPYWQGLYASRPGIKRSTRRLVDAVICAETLAVTDADSEVASVDEQALDDVWEVALASSTPWVMAGIGTDREVRRGQVPALAGAVDRVDAVLARFDAVAVAVPSAVGSVAVSRQTGEVHLDNGLIIVRIDTVAGYVHVATADGQPLLVPPTGELCAYLDTGGLWRFGHEFRGGRFQGVDRTARRRIDLAVNDHGGWAEVVLDAELDRCRVRRTVTVVAGRPSVRLRTEVAAPPRRSVGMALRLAVEPTRLAMAQAGGWVRDRALVSPEGLAGWPLTGAALVDLPGRDHALVLAADAPTAVSFFGTHGEIVVARNATRERAWGVVGFPGLATAGHEPGTAVLDVAVGVVDADAGPGEAEHVAADAMAAVPPGRREQVHALVASRFTVDHPEVRVSGVHRSEDGDALLVRLVAAEPPGEVVRITPTTFEVASAERCDALERARVPLAVVDGAVEVMVDRSVLTVRVTPRW